MNQGEEISTLEIHAEPFTMDTLTKAAARILGGMDDDRARFASKMLGAKTYKARRKAARVKLLAKAEEIMEATRGGCEVIRNGGSMFMFATGRRRPGIFSPVTLGPDALHQHDFCIPVWEQDPSLSSGIESIQRVAGYRCGCGVRRY